VEWSGAEWVKREEEDKLRGFMYKEAADAFGRGFEHV